MTYNGDIVDTLHFGYQTAVRDKISLFTKTGPENDKRNILRAELDSIRDQQMANKNSRGKTLDQIKALQDGIQRKVWRLTFVQTFL